MYGERRGWRGAGPGLCGVGGTEQGWGWASYSPSLVSSCPRSVLRMAHHRHSALVALAGEDHGITVWDAVACRCMRWHDLRHECMAYC